MRKTKAAQIVLCGMSHHTTPIELREKLYIREDSLAEAKKSLLAYSAAIQECVIVSTCNRLEVYAVGEDAAQICDALTNFLCEYYTMPLQQILHFLQIRYDEEAVLHLMRVASGLDSMIIGEDQILGQVTQANTIATHEKTAGTILNRLFSHVSHTGKRVRTETVINRYTTSVSHAAVHLIAQHFGRVHEVKVLLLGAGEMAELAAHAMTSIGLKNFRVANRTFANAQSLAERFDAKPITWPGIYEEMVDVDVVLAATGAPHTILHSVDLQPVLARRNGGPDLLMVDIAVPRNIEATIDHLEKVKVFDIDTLKQVVDANLAQRRACIPDAERIIKVEMDAFLRWWRERQVVPTISALRSNVRSMAHEELQHALSRMPDLEERERRIVQRLVHRIVNKVLHTPTISLRHHASLEDLEEFTEMIYEIFSLDQQETAEQQETTQL